ncbi:epoxide hydrolase [Micromonospora sp. WMMD710]|uniref:epoxide hydrolase family protein n=1 Tax=Micromonospora sp. WMMD710 TaxID=3016085 RepID=UPI0024162F64|nr:epoxide hydrolase [Micromonospora sp. WMMD710]MDG4761904.1 epoxide hydrolase [Micromonospora sp. WMMD710]
MPSRAGAQVDPIRQVQDMSDDIEIRPFRLDTPEEVITDLRRRVAGTRWPTRELAADRSQGVQLATIQEVARYWATEHDWRTLEAKLNALPQYTTVIDGVEIHVIHVRSQHETALPLIMTHGWPGSDVELLGVVGPLTDPTAHGGSPEDAFHLVLPSLPGYGFSGEPAEPGWDSNRMARAWAVLMMDRLGYPRYVAQGGDVGAAVTDAMGRQGPDGLLGIHVNLLAGAIGIKDQLPAKSEQERAAHDALNLFTTDGFGYLPEQSTRPQTIGYSLTTAPSATTSSCRRPRPCRGRTSPRVDPVRRRSTVH